MNIRKLMHASLLLPLIFILSTASLGQKKADKIALKWMKEGSISCVSPSNTVELKIDTITVNKEQRSFSVQLNKTAGYFPLREETRIAIKNKLQEKLSNKYKQWNILVYIDSMPLEQYIPNYYRNANTPQDTCRNYYTTRKTPPIIKIQNTEYPTQGLYNHNIALWHSHGLYYDANRNIWSWQRPPLFGSIEDLTPLTFVLPYIAPMLENAGANTFIPRERDTNKNEIIIDADGSSTLSSLETQGETWQTVKGGFIKRDTLYTGDNPFQMGNALQLKTSPHAISTLKYIPNIPESGNYAVYLSWKQGSNNISNAQYTIYHSGGSTHLEVNQKMGGGTWIYAGTYPFVKGKQEAQGAISLTNQSNEEGSISSDAIRIGGGMGNVARCNADSSGWIISGVPRYIEGARYYLQYSGCPDTLVYQLSKKVNDYTDDYQSRGMWVNYLRDSLHIPIDLSLAFHTDAGVSESDSIIGTLAIYSSVGDSLKLYHNGVSKMANRDLADLVQTQIVTDIQKTFEPNWTRRAMWDKQYSEARRPDVPSMLLELLSHQNLADATWAHNPQFQFTVSRAIYKGILRFICTQENRPYVVQPLPVTHMRIDKQNAQQVKITWQPTVDSLEPTATPTQYIVYTRKGTEGFDNGTFVNGTEILRTLDTTHIYSFKVCAYNEGGKSFPSEILAAYLGGSNTQPIAVVNAFNRVDAPSTFRAGNLAGVAPWGDEGVPFIQNIGSCGNQYDFQRQNNWQSDANPGWGATNTNTVGIIIPGNTFDFVYQHGSVFKSLNYSFVSLSNESFCAHTPQNILALDILLGEQRTSYFFNDTAHLHPQFEIYTPVFQQALYNYLNNQNGRLIVSGAHLGSETLQSDSLKNFAKNQLHFVQGSDHASVNGNVYSTSNTLGFNIPALHFNTTYSPNIYKVESPDAIEAWGKNSTTFLRYNENNKGAAIAYADTYKVVALGFPFETITPAAQAKELMKQILQFLTAK